jgi:hypothetical protein
MGFILGSWDLHYWHIDSYVPAVLTVFWRKLDLSSLLIMAIRGSHKTIHICMVFGYDLLCDFVRNVELINIGALLQLAET